MNNLIPQRTDEVVLYTDQDQREINRLLKVIETAVQATDSPRRIGDDEVVVSAAQAYDDFVAAAAERGTKVVLTYIAGRKWRGYVAQHPPRKDNEVDDDWGFNFLTLGDDVVPPCVVSIAGKELEGEALTGALDSLSDGDFSRVYSAVLRLNTGRGPDPKDSISARLRSTSSETSESPARLG